MTCYIGIDIGGTNIRCLQLLETEIHNPEIRPLPESLSEMEESILEMVINQIAERGNAKRLVIGVGCAGFVTLEGSILNSPNIAYLKGINLKERLTQKLKAVTKLKGELVLENDLLAATCGELSFGNLKPEEKEDFLFVAFGTGIGSGRVINGDLYRGANGLWGEVGHTKVTDQSLGVCGCGREGCWEQIASGTAYGKLITKAIQNGEAPKLAAISGKKTLTAKEFSTLLETEIRPPKHNLDFELKEECLKIISDFASNIVLGLKNLISICDPGCIILGGGVMSSGPELFDAICEEMESTPGPTCKLKLASNIELGGAMGALQIARLKH